MEGVTMALSKGASSSKDSDVTNIPIGDTESFDMEISKNDMKYVIERLTDLYSDPIASTVRETLSNAIDAMMSIPEGKRQPVEVSSPSIMNKFFVVKDHGCGMSFDDVKEIYTKYGSSTKKNDYGQIGAYGLGAKAPLSYCQNFFVTTIKDGKKTSFEIVRGEQTNSVNILDRSDTTEGNGTEVKIPVLMNDESEFNKNIQKYKVYSFGFPITIDGSEVKPSAKIIKLTDIVVDEESNTSSSIYIETQPSEINYFLHKVINTFSSFDNGYSRSIDIEIDGILHGWNYKLVAFNKLQKLQQESELKNNILVELKPGLVDFSSSREEVTNNSRKNDLIKKVVKGFMDFVTNHPEDLISMISKKLDEKDLNIFYYDLKNDGRVPRIDSRIEDALVNVSDDYYIDKNGQSISEFCGKNTFLFDQAVNNLRTYNRFRIGNRFFVLNKSYDGNRTLSISDTKNALMSFYESPGDNDKKINLLDYFNKNRNYLSKDSFVLIVTGLHKEDSKKVNKIWTGRKTLGVFLRRGNLFFTEDDVDKDAIENLGKLFDVKITVANCDDLIEYIKGVNKQRWKQQGTRTYDINALTISDGSMSTHDFTNNSYARTFLQQNGHVKKNFNDFKDEDFILVFSENKDIAFIFNELDNNNEEVNGKTVYLCSDNHLNSKHYSQLLPFKDKLLFSSQWPVKSNVARGLAEGRMFSQDVNNKEVSMLSPYIFYSYAFKKLASNTNRSDYYINIFMKNLLTILVDTIDDKDIFNVIHNVSLEAPSVYQKNTFSKFAETRLSKEGKITLNTLNEFIGNASLRLTYDWDIISSFIFKYDSDFDISDDFSNFIKSNMKKKIGDIKDKIIEEKDYDELNFVV